MERKSSLGAFWFALHLSLMGQPAGLPLASTVPLNFHMMGGSVGRSLGPAPSFASFQAIDENPWVSLCFISAIKTSVLYTLFRGMGFVQLIIIIRSLVRVFVSACVFIYIQVGVYSSGKHLPCFSR